MSLILKKHLSLILQSIKKLLSNKVDRSELEEEISKISEKIPQSDWSQNDNAALDYIKNRTHYEEIVNSLLFEGDIRLTSSSSGEGCYYSFPQELSLTDGNKYSITYNGETVSAICSNGIINLGNVFGGYNVYIDSRKISIDYPNFSSSHLIIVGEISTIKTLDEKFIPDTIPRFNTAIGRPGEGIQSEIFNNYELNTASGSYSHAEGYNTEASGSQSHAEGGSTTASGSHSHAEGYNTIASGHQSHAEGYNTIASGHQSHAEGYNTIASGNYSHVEGRYNIPDSNDVYAHIVGNGNYEAGMSIPSNAHTLDWEGNAWYSGDVYVGSTSGTNRDEGSKKLATVEEVEELASQISSQPYVVQAEEPEDKKLFWVDLDDDTEDPDLNEAIEAAISEAKAASIPVPNVAEIGQTIVVKTVDENGKPTAWEAVELPKGEAWEDICDITTEEEASVIYHNFGAKYKKIKVTFEYDFGENVATGIFVHENTEIVPGNTGQSASWMVSYANLKQGVMLFTSFAKENRFLGTGEKHYVNVGINTTSKSSFAIAGAIYQPICRLAQMPSTILNSDEYIEKGIFSLRIAFTNATAIFPAGTRLYVKGVRV